MKQINKHLAKKPECKEFYSQEELISDSKEKRRASKKSFYEANKAEIRKQNAASNVKCHLRNENFSSQQHLDRHIETVHVQFDKHLCSICEEDFPREDSLARHMNNIHKSEKKLKCPACPLTFARKDTLTKHVRRASDDPEKHGILFHCKAREQNAASNVDAGFKCSSQECQGCKNKIPSCNNG